MHTSSRVTSLSHTLTPRSHTHTRLTPRSHTLTRTYPDHTRTHISTRRLPPKHTHTQAPSDGTHGPAGTLTLTPTQPTCRPHPRACPLFLAAAVCLCWDWGSRPGRPAFPPGPRHPLLPPQAGSPRPGKHGGAGSSGFAAAAVARASWPLGPPELKQVEQPHISSPGLFPFSIWHLLRGEEPETLESPSLRGPPSRTCEHKRPGAPLRRRPSGPSSPQGPVPSPGLRSRCAFRLCRRPFLTRVLLTWRPSLMKEFPESSTWKGREGTPRASCGELGGAAGRSHGQE